MGELAGELVGEKNNYVGSFLQHLEIQIGSLEVEC